MSGFEKDWQHQAVALANTNTMSWREIARVLNVGRTTVSDFLRSYFTERNLAIASAQATVDAQQHDNSRILFISDMHIPYHHPKMIPFLEGLKKRYEPTRYIFIGDELDKHAMSFHDSDPDLPSAGDELLKALPVIKEVKSLIPVADVIESNHGSLVYRKAKHHGIPRRYIKPYNEVLGIDDGWKWHMDLTLELPDGQKVYVHHGKSSNGLQLSQTMGMSCVQGHFHEAFNIQYWANPLALHFSMQIGCLIDDDALSFAYNNTNLKRPLIGCGLIIDGIPVLEAMPL